jgi:N6-adenosine-specific RNA methylase IME4
VSVFEGLNIAYKTIYADPPWWETGGGKIKRGADKHYPLMKTPDIATLPVVDLADPEGSHLYLWATNNHLKDAFAVMEAWGFRYVTMITWLKDGNPGLGQYYRGKTEHCLFGVRGMVPYKVIDGKRAQGVTGFIERRREHSRKPDEMRRMIERVSCAPRIELFARDRFDGWDAWGNHENLLEEAIWPSGICFAGSGLTMEDG